jgi:hypothetical protein
MAKTPTSRGGKAAQDKEALLIQTVRSKAQRYLRWPNITSVGVGYRYKDGQRTEELAIQFTVERKLAPESLALEDLQPLPETITADDGTEIPVDVVQRSYRPTYRIVGKTPGARDAGRDLVGGRAAPQSAGHPAARDQRQQHRRQRRHVRRRGL